MILRILAHVGCRILDAADRVSRATRPAPVEANPGHAEAAAAFADADAAWDEPDTPEFHALTALFARIDEACAEWAVEVAALADLELAELTEENDR